MSIKIQRSKVKIPLDKAYGLLNHGPVVLVSSFYKGRPNVQTVAWNMPLDFAPPLVALVIGRDNYSYECILATSEFVINIPNISLLKKVVQCGSVSGRKVDKFKKFGLTAASAQTVKAPIIAECIGHLECVLIDKPLARKYDLFIGKVKMAWVERDAFKDRWLVEKKIARTIHHLGGRYFTVPARTVSL